MSCPRLLGTTALAVFVFLGCDDQAREAAAESPWAAFSREDYDTAEAEWQSQLREARRTGSAENEATALCNLAFVSERRGALGEAARSLRLCIEKAEPGGRTWSIGIQRLAKLQADRGEPEEAETVLVNALQEFQGDTPIDLAMRSFLFSKLGSLHRAREDFDRSAEFYQQAISAARVAGDQMGEAAAWGDLAWVYADQGKSDDATAACEKRIRIVSRQDPSESMQVRKECQELSADPH